MKMRLLFSLHKYVKIVGVALALALAWQSYAWAGSGFWEDLVFAPKSFGRPHGVSLVEVKEGLLATWFSAPQEAGSDAQIFGARWIKKKGAWTKPFVIVDKNYTKSLGNTALFRDDDGIIWLFFAAVRVGGWSGSMIDYMQSKDDGKTWSEGTNLISWPGNLPRNIPVKTADHEMLAPFYVDFWLEAGIVGSYTAKINYKNGDIVKYSYSSLENKKAIQPTLVKLPNGRIVLLARDTEDKNIWRAFSDDNGTTWTKAQRISLPNPGSAVSAIYVKEVDAILVTYNHSRKKRDPISLGISRDGGKTFKRIANLATSEEGVETKFAYPAMLQTSDGLIHIIWSHRGRATLKHVIFNVDWLRWKIKSPELGPWKISKPQFREE